MKKALLIIGVVGLVAATVVIQTKQLDLKTEVINLTMENKQQTELVEKEALQKRLQDKAKHALLYAQEKNLDLDNAILVDFSIHSGKERFFLWDYKTNTVSLASMCAHGMGNKDKGFESTHTNIVYSNVDESYCSSLGKYKIGISSYSNWGINVHYKLHGLEKTNSNAFKRIVVLHSHSPIPTKEIYPRHLPLGYSLGCPVINNEAMTKVDKLIKKKEKPMLLWIIPVLNKNFTPSNLSFVIL